MLGHYILDGHQPVQVDWETWAEWWGRADRNVAQDHVGDVHISTVFLSLDHQFRPDAPPLLFETMIFGGQYADYVYRYSTWDEAVAGHARAVALVKGSEPWS